MKHLIRLFGSTALALGLVMLLGSVTQAEDIDLFTGVNPAGGNVPTVMLYMHNTRNANANVQHNCTYNDETGNAANPALGNTVGGMEQCAMVNALLSIKNNPQLLGRINVGLMVFNNSQFSSFNNGSSAIGNGNGECGYVSFVPTLMDSGGIDAIVASIKTYDGNNYLVPNRALGDGMASAWAMLNGLQDNCADIDYSTLSTTATECRDAVIVYVGNLTKTNAKAEDDPSGRPRVDELLKAQLTNAFGYSATSAEYKLFTSEIDVTGLNDGNGLYQADDWARFMKRVNVNDSAQNDRNITTYTIGVYDPSLTSQLQDQINYLSEMAKQGGGKPFTVQASESQGFEDILIQIFTEVQAVNSVFSSATLPVSANTQGTFLNQVYIAMFRPNAQAGPRWFGNVKQYQLGFDSGGNIALADATQNPESGPVVSATNPNNGAITDSAISFWTTNSPSNQADWPDEGYWINDPKGAALQFDSPDGDLVEKGGAGQMERIDFLKNQSARKVYSCTGVGQCGSPGNTFTEFTRANFESNGDTLFGLTASGGGAPTVTIGSINGVDAELRVNYQCATSGGNRGQCTFTLNGATVDVFPGFNSGSGSGNSKVPADKIGISGLGNTTCTFDAPCDIVTFGAGANPFFVVDMGRNFSPTSGTNVPIGLFRYSAHVDVNQSSHGYSVGEEIELTNCTADAGGTHSNEDVVATASGTFIEEVETVVSSSAYTVALDGNSAEVALSTGITCGGGTAAITAANLIDWIRGLDNAGNETSDGPCPLNSDGSRTANDGTACSINVRPSIHGDVLHSRPAVINYGDIDSDNPDGESDVVVFYGSNDGHFRAINGNQERSINGVRPGGSLWSFIAPDFFTKFPRQFNDDPKINYTGIVDPDAVPRDYFFDGSTAILQDNRDYDATTTPTGGKKFIFLSARRGGAILYALDVTDATTPKFLWTKTNADIPELGQTWSQPKVTLVEGHTNPVVIFGAGYDAGHTDSDPATMGEDHDPAPPVSDINVGRGIIVLDALDGSLVWAALADCTGVAGATAANCVDNTTLTNDLERPIAADITLFDNDFDGVTDRLYAADLGGHIWRVDLQPNGNTAPSNWTLTQLADISGTGNDARKFFFPPDVIPTSSYDMVVAVSGDREKPLFVDDNTAGLAYNVNNRFYLIVDKNGGDSVPANNPVITESNLVDRTGTKCLNSSNQVVACSYDATDDRYEESDGTPATLITLTQIVDGFSGFYITLEGDTDNDGDSEGEKGINAPLAIAGKVFFGTNQPDTPTEGSCTANLGVARGYKVDIFTGETQVNIFSGGGMPPSPIGGLVTIGDETVPFIIGGEGPSAFDPSTPQIDVTGGRKRTYWYYK